MAIITSNEDLANFVKEVIKESGEKKSILAENLGLSRQGLNNLLNKKSFSIDDATKILNAIYFSMEIKLSLDTIYPEIFQTPKTQKIIKKMNRD